MELKAFKDVFPDRIICTVKLSKVKRLPKKFGSVRFKRTSKLTEYDAFKSNQNRISSTEFGSVRFENLLKLDSFTVSQIENIKHKLFFQKYLFKTKSLSNKR